ncbi:MAG: hypothetical protein HON23_00335 [Rickettsiales bacterium]|jgi:outer membrane lipoprotein-sorting protein|nr:hypothetical protein [Rickettsiales bacterium]
MLKNIIICITLTLVSLTSFAKEVEEIEQYLNNIKTFKAGFLQLDSSDNLVEGVIMISKPGKFKWDYKSQPIQIISDGKTVIFYDKELKQSSFLEVKDSIASLLAEENLVIKRDLNILDFKTDENGTILTIEKPNKKDVKEMSLYFKHEPFTIKRIDVLDYNNNKIEINLFDLVINEKIPSSEFVIIDTRLN